MAKFFIHVGHGGKDSGAVGPTGLKEKDVALAIFKKIKVLLEKHGQTVKLSREVDMGPEFRSCSKYSESMGR